jgi:hypothetical protein
VSRLEHFSLVVHPLVHGTFLVAVHAPAPGNTYALVDPFTVYTRHTQTAPNTCVPAFWCGSTSATEDGASDVRVLQSVIVAGDRHASFSFCQYHNRDRSWVRLNLLCSRVIYKK